MRTSFLVLKICTLAPQCLDQILTSYMDLEQISGATVDVQDPPAGSEGKVIISGTPDQVLAAQSLLQAFMMSAR